jgi:hypothetical protein
MKHYLVSASAIGIAASALATVSSTLVADTYIVKDGAGASAKFYAVLDIYAKGNHLGDVMGGILGVTGHSVVFATSSAQGVTRDAASGKITGGSITSDIFVQSGGSSWLPTNTDGKAWDSFIANGNRRQGDSITNRAGVVKNLGDAANWSAASGFNQMGVANSNFINNGETSGWFTAFGNNPYLAGTPQAPVASENPWARVSLYNSYWNAAYPTLNRSDLTSKGTLVNGAASASAAAAARIDPTSTDIVAGLTGVGGTSLDFHSMIGRFAIDLTGKTYADVITMNVQFNLTGRTGTGNEAGTTFSGAVASTAQYKVSQFFAFAVPAPGAGVLLAAAGLIGRRRKA